MRLAACGAPAAAHLTLLPSSPHPKDFPPALLDVIGRHANICKQLHLPVQSGSSSVLQRMRRGYSRESYLELIAAVRATLPAVTLSSDFISGLCGETEAEHEDTVSLMRSVRYDNAFMFAYSERDKTPAARTMADDVPPHVKLRRLQEVITAFREGAAAAAAAEVGSVQCVLVEGLSKRSDTQLAGRTDGGRRFIVDDVEGAADWSAAAGPAGAAVRLQPGDYVAVRALSSTAASLAGVALGRTTLRAFHDASGGSYHEV